MLFYPTLLWNLLLSKLCPSRHWWDRVDETVILGALPGERHIPGLVAEGVCAVVNACGECPGPTAAYDRVGITQLHLPIIDFTSPGVEEMKRVVAFIAEHSGWGSVYVHCKAGRGRSATLVLGWLISRGLSPEEAQRLLSSKRPHVMPRLYQRRAVQQFAQQCS